MFKSDLWREIDFLVRTLGDIYLHPPWRYRQGCMLNIISAMILKCLFNLINHGTNNTTGICN
jgi:hypothetical protein